MPVSRGAAPSGSFNNFGRIALQVPGRVQAVIKAAAFNINDRIQGSFREPKSGRYYGAHQASAPGEAPAIDFGAYAGSIRVIAADKYQMVVATSSEQGPYLEFGARHMEARPHFAPAAEEERDDFEKAMKSALGGTGRLYGDRGLL